MRGTPLLRIGIIGCGVIGGLFGRLLSGADPISAKAFADRVELVAVAAAGPDRARSLAEELGCAQETVDGLLNRTDIDAVCVCTPSGTHADIGERAVAAGKHVLVEKPIDVALHAADRLISAADAADRVLGVVFQHRFDPAAQLAHRAIKDGELGTITSITIEVPWWRSQAYYASGSWRGTRSLDGGGSLMNQAIHALDLVQWLAGPVVEVMAHTALSAHSDIDVEDVATATLRLESGALGTLLATTSAYPGRNSRVSVNGDRGSLVIEDDELVYFHSQADATDDVGFYGAYGAGNQVGTRTAGLDRPDQDRDRGGLLRQPHRDLLLDFCSSVETGAAPAASGREARRSLETVVSVYQSAACGTSVRISTEGEPHKPAGSPDRHCEEGR